MATGRNVANVVLLSGPVGAGKTAVARELVAALPEAAASIEGDTFWSFIAKPKTQSFDQAFKMIMRAMLSAARHFERDGYDVILDFSIPPWYLDATRKLLQDKPFDYVVLRPSEAVCAARAATRKEGAIADYAPYRDLYASFDVAERFIVADDHGDAAALAARIRKGLQSGAFRIATPG